MKNTVVNKDVVQAVAAVATLTFKQVRKGMLIAITYPAVERVKGVICCAPGTFVAVVDSKGKSEFVATFDYEVRKAKVEYVRESQTYTFKLTGLGVEHHGPAVQGTLVTLSALTEEQVAAWQVKMAARKAFLDAKAALAAAPKAEAAKA